MSRSVGGSGAAPSRFTLRLAKEDFKFSVAHFTIFGAERAEPLHGHNYRLRLELEGEALDDVGLLDDSGRWKRAVRALCAELDDRVLLPARSPHVAIEVAGEETTVGFGAREYRLPTAETLALPLANVSMELLARWAWERLAPLARSGSGGVSAIAVEIEETPGQLCRYRAELGGAELGSSGAAAG